MGQIRDAFQPRVGANVSDLTSPAEWMYDATGGRRTASGERVTPTSSMSLAAYFAGLRNLSEDEAKLPKQVRRRLVEGSGSERVFDHPLARVIRRPNPMMGWFEFARTLNHWRFAWGNAYAAIQRNGLGDVLAFWPLPPWTVTIKREGDDPMGWWYEYRAPGKAGQVVYLREMLHLRGLGDGFTGYSVAQYHAESVGFGLAAQRFGARFFGDDGAMRMVASVDKVMTPQGRAGLRKRIMGDRKENGDGARQMPIIDVPVKIQNIGIPPEDAQFIETQKFNVEEMARWFRMPPAKLQASDRAQGWSTLELANTDYANDALIPASLVWEEELSAKCLREDERDGMFIKTVFQALLRGDFATRTQGYSTLIAAGVMKPEEARELEDLNPSGEDGAGRLWMQSAMAPVEQLAKEPEPPPETPPSPGPFPPASPDDTPEDMPPDEESARADDMLRRDIAMLHPVFLDAGRRVASKEANALVRAFKRHAGNAVAFDAWAGQFYDKLRETAYEAFVPCGRSLAGPIADSADVEGRLRAWSLRLPVPASMRDLVDGGIEARSEDLANGAMADVVSLIEEVSRA